MTCDGCRHGRPAEEDRASEIACIKEIANIKAGNLMVRYARRVAADGMSRAGGGIGAIAREPRYDKYTGRRWVDDARG